MNGDSDYGSRRGATSRDDNSRNNERQLYDSRSERNFSGMSGDNNYRSRRDVTSRDYGRQRYDSRSKMNSLADRDQDWKRRSDDVSTGNHIQEINNDFLLRVLDNVNRNVSSPSEDTIKHFPRYNEIKEDRSIMENYKNNLRYIGDYLTVSEDKYNHEDIKFRFLKTEFCPDDRTKCKEVNFDLKVSMEAEEDTKSDHFNCFLKCIAQEPEVLSSLKSDPDEKSEIKFLMTHYTLIQILQMPYILKHLDKDIILGACLESGVIYMYMCKPPSIDTVIDLNKAPTDSDTECETIETEGNNPSEEEKFNEPGILSKKFIKQNWSHKFKQYMCNEDVTKGKIPNEKFRIVVASKLGPYDVLVNPKTDCLNPELYKGERDLSAFVRLYTTRYPFNSISREKCYEWALPMIVGGTEEMIAGYFKLNGILSEVRSYTVDDLLKRGKGCGNLDKNFTFAVDFLDFVKEQTLSNPGVKIFFIKKEGERFLTCRKSFPRLVIEKGETDPKLKYMNMKFQYNWFSEAVKNA